MKVQELFFAIVVLVLSSSCASKNERLINSEIVLNYFDNSIQSTSNSVSTIDSVVFIEKTQNKEDYLSFENTFDLIQRNLIEIDTIPTNNETKLYLKSLLIADFVFASFGNYFLSSLTENDNNFRIKKDWEKLTLKEQYNFGVKNLIGFDCGMKTSFFISVIDSLLGLKVRDIAITGVHTFPLVTIGGKRYIIDPFNPYVFINSNSNKILGFDEMKNQLKNLKSISTRRKFGKTRFLVSDTFYDRFFEEDKTLKANLINFSKVENTLIQNSKPVCFISSFESTIEYYYLKGSPIKMIISSGHSNFGSKLSTETVARDYLNVPCNYYTENRKRKCAELLVI